MNLAFSSIGQLDSLSNEHFKSSVQNCTAMSFSFQTQRWYSCCCQSIVCCPVDLFSFCLTDLKKTLAVLLDNIMLRLGKLESKVENIYNGTGSNLTNSASTATPSATNAEKVNVAGRCQHFQWFCWDAVVLKHVAEQEMLLLFSWRIKNAVLSVLWESFLGAVTHVFFIFIFHCCCAQSSLFHIEAWCLRPIKRNVDKQRLFFFFNFNIVRKRSQGVQQIKVSQHCTVHTRHFMGPDHILGHHSNKASVHAAWPFY